MALSKQASANGSQRWSPEWESDAVLVKYIRDDNSPQRYRLSMNCCRGQPKINFEAVHSRAKLGTDGKWGMHVQRVFGKNNYIRLELDQGIMVLQKLDDLYNQLRRDESVVVEHVNIAVKGDDVTLTRNFVMPNIEPSKMTITMGVVGKLLDCMTEITDAAEFLRKETIDLFADVNKINKLALNTAWNKCSAGDKCESCLPLVSAINGGNNSTKTVRFQSDFADEENGTLNSGAAEGLEGGSSGKSTGSKNGGGGSGGSGKGSEGNNGGGGTGPGAMSSSTVNAPIKQAKKTKVNGDYITPQNNKRKSEGEGVEFKRVRAAEVAAMDAEGEIHFAEAVSSQ